MADPIEAVNTVVVPSDMFGAIAGSVEFIVFISADDILAQKKYDKFTYFYASLYTEKILATMNFYSVY